MELKNTDLLGHSPARWVKKTLTYEELNFCFFAAINTIDSCLLGKYSNFDAPTTTNCCHGLALFAKSLIQSVLQFDLHKIRAELVTTLQSIDKI